MKYKRRMLYFPMEVKELNIDVFIDTVASSSAIPEKDLRKNRSLALNTTVNEGHFQSVKQWLLNQK